jgi:tetratricopeptide (TPR) repeat protein
MKKYPIRKSRCLTGPSHKCKVSWQSRSFPSNIHVKFTAELIILLILIINPVLNINAQQNDSITFYLQKYDYGKVIDLIDKTDNYESDLRLLNSKATALKGLNKYQQAIVYYEILYREDSSDTKNVIELADCYQSLGDYKMAQKLYFRTLKLNPVNDYLIQQLANSYYMDDNFEQAKKYYLTAYATDSTFYLSKQLAKCYDILEIIDTAILYYRKSISLNPSDFQSSYRLANLYKQKEDYKKGISVTDTFLCRDSMNIKMLKLSGSLHFLDKNFTRSAERFEQCIALNDTSDLVNKYLGYSYFKIEKYEKAKDYLEKAYLRDTMNADLCYTLGLSCDYSIYKKLGIKYLSKTIDLVTPAPEFLSRIYQDLAAAYTGYYKYEEALESFLKGYELNPNDTLLIFKIASHYDNRIKDKNKALTYYQKFIETRPIDRKPLPTMHVEGGIVVSYYDYVERRMKEIKEELFWKGEKQNEGRIKK